MTNLQILKHKTSKILSIFAIFIVSGFMGLTSVQGQGIDVPDLGIGIAAIYKVKLSAPSTTYSGTYSTIWFRLYSDDKGAWGSWHSINGLNAGASKTVTVSEVPGFTDITHVQVYEGQNDGVRLNINVSSTWAGTLFSYPFNKWVKNGYSTLDLFYPVP